ncbi:STAS/SEC14 domain-containing protein [Marixanthomonas sp. SCSIO 43207]|uniref:STAS/SEC14 domain-containing protein n=1 Tax=Marixanthomonas sp. SCSIO 43207 TaxID=2779360 RepID=UPI001CA8B9D4|nr:STAS/SEC14 domain-containing protein [Marixanthomonas sp. SCSIO 43207]UAB81573.1 STAS/SEC14 domain-containing protein [Marixanthomonas sp. SCSIO 43207]
MLSNFSFSDSTVGFLIEGKFDTETVNKLLSDIEAKLKVYDQINLYIEDVGIKSFHLPALIKETIFKLKHKDRFYKVALVSNRKWIHACGSISSLFTDSITQNFTSENRLKAMTWIAEG